MVQVECIFGLDDSAPILPQSSGKVLIVETDPERTYSRGLLGPNNLRQNLVNMFFNVDPNIGFFGSLDASGQLGFNVLPNLNIISGSCDLCRLEKMIFQEMDSQNKIYSNRFDALVQYAESKNVNKVIFLCDNSYSIVNQLLFIKFPSECHFNMKFETDFMNMAIKNFKK